MTATTNVENLGQYKIRFSSIAEQILAFASSPNMVREVKKLPPNFKNITLKCFTLMNIPIWIVRFILLVKLYVKFHQKLYSNNLYIVDIIRHFL